MHTSEFKSGIQGRGPAVAPEIYRDLSRLTPYGNQKTSVLNLGLLPCRLRSNSYRFYCRDPKEKTPYISQQRTPINPRLCSSPVMLLVALVCLFLFRVFL